MTAAAHPLHIAVNGAIANQEIESGIVTWDHNILKHLLEVDDRNRYTIYTNGRPHYDFLNSRGRVKNRNVRPFRWFGRPLNLASGGRLGSTLEQVIAADLLLARPYVYFQTAHSAQPLLMPVPSIVMVFDVAYLMPEFQPYFETHMLAQLIRNTAKAIQRAAHVLALSENTKRDVAAFYGVPPERITVVYPGVDQERFHPISRDVVEAAKRRYSLSKPYWIHVGALQPRKNVRRLFEAMRMLKAARELQHQLVLAGGSGWLESATKSAVGELQLEDDVRFVGHLPMQDLPALISGADLLATPSLYEGFGLTVVEAMACGVPVLASNTSSLPEAGGRAAMLIDPKDTQAWALALRRIAGDRELAAEMRAKGLRQAARFTWQRAAEQVLALLEKVGARAPANPGRQTA